MPEQHSQQPRPAPGGDPEADRRQKLRRLREELGVDPYGERTEGLIPLTEARARYDGEADAAHKQNPDDDRRPAVKVAGRIVLHRDIGKLVFMTLRDGSGDLQVAASKKALSPTAFQQAKLADLGDIAVAEGALGKTKTGEITIWTTSEDQPAEDQKSKIKNQKSTNGFAIATKSLAPPPEKYHGLRDPELRYRHRYVDLYANPEVMATFRERSRIVKRVRDFLTDPPAPLGPGYLEVETPMMQPIAGGAAARPFITHHNALDIDLYLRIAPELYLKRLLVGGMDRVFEINRNFRNEGIDRSHNPEFTMLELYQAFGDYHSMMELTETLVSTLACKAADGIRAEEAGIRAEEAGIRGGNAGIRGEDGSRDNEGQTAPTLPYGSMEIDYATPFHRATYHGLFEEVNGFPPSDRKPLADLAHRHHIDPAGKDPDVLLNEVWEETVEPTLIQPTFVMDYPAPLCPLTKRKADDPDLAERFELFIAGMEIANAYTELNDPDVQRANFEAQTAGLDEEEATFRATDEDFLEALRVGMPPAGGLGVGVDRLVMLLTNARSIRDAILFPLLRPQKTPIADRSLEILGPPKPNLEKLDLEDIRHAIEGRRVGKFLAQPNVALSEVKAAARKAFGDSAVTEISNPSPSRLAPPESEDARILVILEKKEIPPSEQARVRNQLRSKAETVTANAVLLIYQSTSTELSGWQVARIDAR